MADDIIRQRIKSGSIKAIRAIKFGIIKDHRQSFSQEAITKKKKNTVAIINGNGTIVPVFGTQAV